MGYSALGVHIVEIERRTENPQALRDTRPPWLKTLLTPPTRKQSLTLPADG